MGQTIYVLSIPISGDQQEIFNLAATLSIRNTDVTNSIIITSVRYYNSDGRIS